MIILLILMFSFPAQTDITNRQHHDIHHITGSCIGTAYLNHAGMSWWKAAGVMFAAGVIWECMDELSHAANWHNDVFDYREGFSRGDVLRNGIGITLSIPIRR